MTLSSCEVSRDRGEFLIGRVVGRCHVVGKEDSVSDDVTELDNSVLENWLASFGCVWYRFTRKDFPVIIGIIEGIASDLLALTRDAAIVVSERILIRMAVEESLGVFMTKTDDVVVEDVDSLGMHDVVAKCLLKLWGHEIISRPRSRENSEMDLEPEQVEKERHNDQANGSSHEMLAKGDHVKCPFFPIDIKQSPQVDEDSTADCEEGECSDILCRDDTAHGEASQKEPFPPLAAECIVSLFVEPDIA